MVIQIPEKVNKIIKRLQEHGYDAYAVGGCVRDSSWDGFRQTGILPLLRNPWK